MTAPELAADLNVLALVRAVLPGAKRTARRTPEAFAGFWAVRTDEHRLRKRAEKIATVWLEQLQQQRRQAPVATTEITP